MRVKKLFSLNYQAIKSLVPAETLDIAENFSTDTLNINMGKYNVNVLIHIN